MIDSNYTVSEATWRVDIWSDSERDFIARQRHIISQ